MTGKNGIHLVTCTMQKMTTPSNEFVSLEEFELIPGEEPAGYFKQYIVYNDDEESKGFFYYPVYSSMELFVTREFFNVFKQGYHYCHPSSLKGIEEFIDASAYTNAIQFEKVKKYIAHVATDIMEGHNFLVIKDI